MLVGELEAMRLKGIEVVLLGFFIFITFGCQQTKESHQRAKASSLNLNPQEIEPPKSVSDIHNATEEKEAEHTTAGLSHNTTQSNSPANQSVATEKATSTADPNNQNQQKISHTVIAFYFHPTFRCQACLDIEALSQEAIESGFEKAIENGDLVWVVLNMEELGAEGFVEEFQLDTSTLVIADMRGGQQTRWKKLDKVWELKDDRDAFVKYVQDEAAAYLASD